MPVQVVEIVMYLYMWKLVKNSIKPPPRVQEKGTIRGGKTTQAPFASLTMGHVKVSC